MPPQLSDMTDAIRHPESTSLREQKRAVVRQALSRAALQLVLQRGLEDVLVADIATAAGVSPRTFNNYFSSKEEAVVAPAFDRMANVLAAFRERPTSEPLWESVTAAIVAQFPEAGREDGDTVRHVRLISDSPGLWAEQLKVYVAIERLLARAIAERLGVHDDELFPHLVAAAAISASRVAFEHCLAADHGEPFPTVLTHALTQLKDAFPDAPVSRPR